MEENREDNCSLNDMLMGWSSVAMTCFEHWGLGCGCLVDWRGLFQGGFSPSGVLGEKLFLSCLFVYGWV